MLFIIFSAVILVIGIIGLFVSDDWAVWDEVCTVMGIIMLFFTLLAIPISRVGITIDIQERKAFIETISVARAGDLGGYERAAITKDIAVWNQWLTREQYLKNDLGFVCGVYIPDEVNNLAPIK